MLSSTRLLFSSPKTYWTVTPKPSYSKIFPLLDSVVQTMFFQCQEQKVQIFVDKCRGWGSGWVLSAWWMERRRRRRRPSRADVEGVQPDERLSLLPLPPNNIAALWALAVTRAGVRKCAGRCGSLSADVARPPQQSSPVVTRFGEDEAELSHGLILWLVRSGRICAFPISCCAVVGNLEEK